MARSSRKEPRVTEPATASTDPQLAFVFPGQGSQSLGMLSDLAQASPVIKQAFAEASEGAGVDLWSIAQDGPEKQLNQTEFTQPALLAAGVAVWRLWNERGGARPAQLAGHSLGEYAALVAAGAVYTRIGKTFLPTMDEGSLIVQLEKLPSISLEESVAEDALVQEVCDSVSGKEVVVPANFNSPGQIVIGGHAEAVERALALLAERGVRKAVKLAVSVPSHTPLMREAANRLAEAMKDIDWHAPSLPVVQNVDAEVHDGIESIRDALVRQLYLPVQWTGCVQALAARGATRVHECGPGKVLTGLVKRIDKSLDARALGTPADIDAALATGSSQP